MRRFAGILTLCAAFAAGCGDASFEEPEDDAWADGKADGAGSTTGSLRVVEVLADPADPEGAFLELVNVGDEAVDLDNWYVSFGSRRVRLDPIDGRPHVVPPGGTALVVDQGLDLDAARVPAWLPVVVPSRDLADLFRTSRRLVLRTPSRVVSDRADASKPATARGVAVERRANDVWVASSLGATPGQRNTTESAAIETFFARPYEELTNALPPAVIAVVDGASRSLDGAFYQLGQPAVIDALIRAQQRGVRVRIVTDTRYYADPDYAPGYQRLVAAGIPVVQDNRTARMHNKFLVIDGEAVFTGSYNPVKDDTRTKFVQADNAVLIRSAELAAIHTAEFEEMFGGKFGPKKSDNTAHEVHVDGARIEVYFAPTDHPKDAILRELSRARDNVYFAMFAFYQDDVGDAMIERFGAGVDVRGIFDDKGSAGDSAQYPRLAAAGVDVRRPTLDLFLHHKFILVNYGTDDPVVITGSYNFSDKADVANDEAVYVIHDRAVADAYYAIFRELYDPAAGTNTDTTGLATLAISEVLSATSSASPFVELVNYGADPVALGGLVIGDRDGAPVALRGLAQGQPASLAPGARLVLSLGATLVLDASDPLVIYDGRRRMVATFDAPGYAGAGQSLSRAELIAPDPGATWVAGAPTPGY